MGRKRKSRIYSSNAEKVQGTNDLDVVAASTPASVEPTNKTSTIRHRKRCRADTRKNKLSNEVVNQKNNPKISSECTNEKPLEKFEDKVLLVPQSSEFTVKDTPCEKKTEDGQITQPQSEEQSCPASSSIDKSVNSEASSLKNARPELCASNEFVKCKNGQVVELYFDKRPESFQTQKDAMMWKVGTYINLRKLRHELETGELAPESYKRKLNMTREELIRQHFIPKEEKCAKRLQFLKDELALTQCAKDLRCSLRSHRPNIKNGEEVLMKLLQIRKLPLMLKKNPRVVETLMQCTHYGDSEVVRKLSAQALENIETLFDIPLGSSFDEVFCSSVNTFIDSTKHLTPWMKQLLTVDPTDPEYEPDLCSSDEGTDSDEVDDSDVDADYSPDSNPED